MNSDATHTDAVAPRDEEPGFTIVRNFAASRDRVWDAWTNPAIMALWYHPKGLHTPRESVSVDLREGGLYTYTMVDNDTGEQFPTGGKYHRVERPFRLDFSWGNQCEEDTSPLVRIVFEEIDAATTRMTFTLTGLPQDSGVVNGITEGWNSAFDVLEATITE